MKFIDQNFKTIQIAQTFIDRNDKLSSVYRFLLPKLLTSHTDERYTKMAFHAHLETLYGAYFKTKATRYGQYHLVTITLTIIDPKIVLDEHLLEQSLQLFHDVIHRQSPISKQIFNEEKRLLIEQWESIKDKKRQYAGHRFQELFYKDDPEGYPISGTITDAKQMTHAKITRYFNDVFLNNKTFLVVSGMLKAEEKALFKKYFKENDTEKLGQVNLGFRALKPLETVLEQTDMKQAMIRMGYHFPIFRSGTLYHAAWLMDTMLGGYPESRLFKEIRENKGLCYDVSSSYNAYKGTVHIGLGVDIAQKAFAVEEVKKLIEQLKVEGFLETELDYAKAYLKHQLKMSLDHQSVLTDRALGQFIFDETMSIEKRITMIDEVQLTDIDACLAVLNLDTVYILHGGAND